MNERTLQQLLEHVRDGSVSIDDAVNRLASLPVVDMGWAQLDTHRQLRTGHPEVVYGEGKTAAQIGAILAQLHQSGQDGLVTRVDQEKAQKILADHPDAIHHPVARIIHLRHSEPTSAIGHIGIVAAGTSDLPVAEEAAVVAECLGNHVARHWDVGVAGIHRILSKRESLRKAKVMIVVAGMEGALASVVAGLVNAPVIAVPTSVGYGASFGGLAALLGMLTSCAAGVSVVNIDNGFGAALQAARINRLGVQ